MIKIKDLQVQPLKVGLIRVTWSFGQTLETFADYKLELQRSLSPKDGYSTIYSFTDAVEFVDEVVYRRLWNNIFYRIRVEQVSTGKETFTPPASIGSAPNLEALEIIRRNDILLKNRRHGIGVPVAVFIRKRDGVGCECYDTNKKRLITADCELCFGSRFEGGFYPPIIAWVNMTPDGKSTPIPQWGEVEPNETRIFMSNYPVVLPRDIVIDTNKMIAWTVETIETTARRGHLLHQLVSMNFLDRKNVAYKLLDKFPNTAEEVKAAEKRIKTS